MTAHLKSRDSVSATRFAQVVTLMQSGKWVRGKTAKELAKTWGVTKDTAEQYAWCASLALDYFTNQREVSKEWIIERLKERVENDDAKDLVPAARLILEAQGQLTKHVKVEAKQAPTPDSVDRVLEIPEARLEVVNGLQRLGYRILPPESTPKLPAAEVPQQK